MKKALLFVNFGGPRNLEEVSPFLVSLLTDPDVVRTKLPSFLQKILFTYIAKKRAKKVSKEYASIGGKSPIFEDTEKVAALMRNRLECPIITFHRYLPATHAEFFSQMEKLDADEILVFPFFPQFTYATSGSIARFFSDHLCGKTTSKLHWIPSYAGHVDFIQSIETVIRSFLEACSLKEEETTILFSAHGVPESFVATGDIYQKECEISFNSLQKRFPKADTKLSYQSQFGKEQWLTPSTEQVCNTALSWTKRKNVVIVPLSFTSDHIETLVEIEHQYLPLLRNLGLRAERCPALNHHPVWMDAIYKIIQDPPITLSNPMLIRHNYFQTSCDKKNCNC